MNQPVLLETLATAAPGRAQRGIAVATCAAFAIATACLLPIAARPTGPMPGFVPAYQTALIVTYAITTYLFYAQYRRTASRSLLLLAAGSLFTTLIVFVQLLTFPNVFAPNRLLGTGPDTTTWLWTFWHLGPPLFALPYAWLERAGPRRATIPGREDVLGTAALLAALGLAGLVTLLVARDVHLLPKTVDGDDYTLLTTSGVGPFVIGLTIVALALLAWTTRLRTVLQLWLAVALFLLVLDNWITMAGSARGTLGWFAGRLEALIAGIILLGVYLREVDFLYARAERTAEERERGRVAFELARDNLALALDAAELGDWHLDLASDSIRLSPRSDRLFGTGARPAPWGRADLLRQVAPEDRAGVEEAFARALEDGPIEVSFRLHRLDDGAERLVILRGRTYRDEAGRPVSMAGIVMDATDRRAVEDRLAQAQKMEAIGQLTGGVAHDFNNLLTIIVGNLDMIVRQPDNVGRVERLAASSLTAARRGAEVTEKLLAFSRRQVVRAETVNPNRLLKNFETLLDRAVGETIEVVLDLDPFLHPVRLDPGQFESAILNLAVNARDAMPAGGRLTVRTCNATVDPVDMPELSRGEFVLVLVTDTGTGMDGATLARAFEPFFTTKDVGKGTGLGLSQVYGFAKQAGGHVRIESAPGEGTTIRLYLPRSIERPAEVRPGALAVPLRRAEHGEVVLIVEDEPSVLEMAVESVRELGYRALTATNARAALERLRTQDRIDILFSDVVMPGGMNGLQLSVEARRLRPGLKVVLASGYVGAGVGEADIPLDIPFLAKPYGREELGKTLQVLLKTG